MLLAISHIPIFLGHLVCLLPLNSPAKRDQVSFVISRDRPKSWSLLWVFSRSTPHHQYETGYSFPFQTPHTTEKAVQVPMTREMGKKCMMSCTRCSKKNAPTRRDALPFRSRQPSHGHGNGSPGCQLFYTRVLISKVMGSTRENGGSCCARVMATKVSGL